VIVAAVGRGAAARATAWDRMLTPVKAARRAATTRGARTTCGRIGTGETHVSLNSGLVLEVPTQQSANELTETESAQRGTGI